MKINILHIKIFLLFLVISCGRNNEPDYEDLLKGKYWNIIISQSDSIRKLNNQPLFIDKDKLCFSNSDIEIGHYSIVKDTLKAVRFVEKNDKAFSSKEVVFLALIKNITKDSLRLKILRSATLSLIEGQEYSFYNDAHNYDASLYIDKIVFSIKSCYQCAAFAIEINSNKKYYYYGNKYSELKGVYVGNIEEEDFEEIQKMIRMNVIFKQPLISMTSDADMCEIIVYFKNGRKEKVKGCIEDFPQRIRELSLKIMNSTQHVKLKKSTINHPFETTLLFEYNKIPPPPAIN